MRKHNHFNGFCTAAHTDLGSIFLKKSNTLKARLIPVIIRVSCIRIYQWLVLLRYIQSAPLTR